MSVVHCQSYYKFILLSLFKGMSILHPRMDKERDSGLTVIHCDSQYDKGRLELFLLAIS